MKKATIKFAIETFGFLITPSKETTFKEFGETISRVYSLENPRTSQLYNTLINSEGSVVRSMQGEYNVEYLG